MIATAPKLRRAQLNGRGAFKAEKFLGEWRDRVGLESGEMSAAHLLATLAYTSFRDARRELGAAANGQETELAKQLKG